MNKWFIEVPRLLIHSSSHRATWSCDEDSHKYHKLLQLHLAQAQDYLGPVTGIHKYCKVLQL